MSVRTSLLLSLLAMAILTFSVAYRNMLRTKRRRLAGRAEMSSEQFYDTFYPQSGLPRSVVTSAIQEIGAATDLPPGLLRPTDRFTQELGAVRGWEVDDGLAVLSADLARRATRAGIPVDVASISTLDEYVRTRAELERLSETKRI